MAIVYKTGNLLDAQEDVICHGVNARGIMTGGVAAAIRRRWPAAYAAYLSRHREGGLTLGSLSYAVCDGKIVANAVTQDGFRQGWHDAGVYVDYEAVRRCVEALNADLGLLAKLRAQADGAEPRPVETVAFPLIGAGLAGGSWPVIADILAETADGFAPVVYTLDGRVPGS